MMQVSLFVNLSDSLILVNPASAVLIPENDMNLWLVFLVIKSFICIPNSSSSLIIRSISVSASYHFSAGFKSVISQYFYRPLQP